MSVSRDCIMKLQQTNCQIKIPQELCTHSEAFLSEPVSVKTPFAFAEEPYPFESPLTEIPPNIEAEIQCWVERKVAELSSLVLPHLVVVWSRHEVTRTIKSYCPIRCCIAGSSGLCSRDTHFSNFREVRAHFAAYHPSVHLLLVATQIRSMFA